MTVRERVRMQGPDTCCDDNFTLVPSWNKRIIVLLGDYAKKQTYIIGINKVKWKF